MSISLDGPLPPLDASYFEDHSGVPDDFDFGPDASTKRLSPYQLSLPDGATLVRRARIGAIGVLAGGVLTPGFYSGIAAAKSLEPSFDQARPAIVAPRSVVPTRPVALDEQLSTSSIVGNGDSATVEDPAAPANSATPADSESDTGPLETVVQGIERLTGLDKIKKHDQITQEVEKPLLDPADTSVFKHDPLPFKPANMLDMNIRDATKQATGILLDETPGGINVPSIGEFATTTIERTKAAFHGEQYVTPDMEQATKPGPVHVFDISPDHDAPSATGTAKNADKIPVSSSPADPPHPAAKTPPVKGKFQPSKQSDSYVSEDYFVLGGDTNRYHMEVDSGQAKVQAPAGTQVLMMDDAVVIQIKNPKHHRQAKLGSSILFEDSSDHTRLEYQGIARNSIPVHEGELVKGGQVVGLVGTPEDGGGHTSQIFVQHLPEQVNGVGLDALPVTDADKALPFAIQDIGGRLHDSKLVFDELSSKAYGSIMDTTELQQQGPGDLPGDGQPPNFFSQIIHNIGNLVHGTSDVDKIPALLDVPDATDEQIPAAGAGTGVAADPHAPTPPSDRGAGSEKPGSGDTDNGGQTEVVDPHSPHQGKADKEPPAAGMTDDDPSAPVDPRFPSNGNHHGDTDNGSGNHDVGSNSEVEDTPDPNTPAPLPGQPSQDQDTVNGDRTPEDGGGGPTDPSQPDPNAPAAPDPDSSSDSQTPAGDAPAGQPPAEGQTNPSLPFNNNPFANHNTHGSKSWIDSLIDANIGDLTQAATGTIIDPHTPPAAAQDQLPTDPNAPGDGTAQVDDNTPELPEATDKLPDATDELPGATDGLPDASGDLPDAPDQNANTDDTTPPADPNTPGDANGSHDGQNQDDEPDQPNNDNGHSHNNGKKDKPNPFEKPHRDDKPKSGGIDRDLLPRDEPNDNSDHLRAVWWLNWFVEHGDMTPQGAAGLVGNISVESADTFDPNINQFDGGPGRGVIQWTESERWQTLLNWTQARGLDPRSTPGQARFIIHELQDYPGTYETLLTTHSVKKASDSVLYHYERPLHPESSEHKRFKRGKVALKIWKDAVGYDNAA